jgi:multidrug efflux pump subunit AcrA (membrane-fusion protein)
LVSSDQQAVAADQATVATDEGALAKLLTAEESSPGSGGSVGSVGSTGSVGSSTTTTTPSKASTGVSNFSGKGSGGSAVSGGSGASSPSDSAATIASDEATIDTAEANLVNAQQSLSDAQLTAPITGTVASVGMSVGDTVSADSSTETIVIIGTQSFEAEATLSSTQVSSVKVGDPADVSVDGTNKPIAGSVSQVGPVQSSDGTYTYPVVVALPPSATGLFAGSSANISITTSQVENVLAVPTSAVNTEGTRSFVVELSAGNPVDKTVKVGVVGYTYTQLISGLKEGDRVVLANYSEAVPTSSATTLGGFGGGGFGGAGRFGAGGAGLGGGGRFTVGGGGATFGG